MTKKDTHTYVAVFGLLVIAGWLLFERFRYIGYTFQGVDREELEIPTDQLGDLQGSSALPGEKETSTKISVPNETKAAKPVVSSLPSHDDLWLRVFGYPRDHNSTQFSGPPFQYVEALSAPTGDTQVELENGVHIYSTVSESAGSRIPQSVLPVCIVTKDVRASLRVRARGAVLLLPCTRHSTQEIPGADGLHRICYDFDFVVPGLYGIEANVTYQNGEGHCDECFRKHFLVIPGYSLHNESVIGNLSIVNTDTMKLDTGGSAKASSVVQWGGRVPHYYGARVRGSPMYVYIPPTTASYVKAKEAIRSEDMEELYRIAWSDTLEWMRPVMPAISANFSVENLHSSRDCADDASKERCTGDDNSLKYCSYEDSLFGFPLWTDVRLLEASNGVSDTGNSPTTFQTLTPYLPIDTHHGPFAIVQLQKSLGAICKWHDRSPQREKPSSWIDWRGLKRPIGGIGTSTGREDIRSATCVRRRWTERQIVHRLQGEHVAFQGDSTLRCLFLQLVGYADSQWTSVAGWMPIFKYHLPRSLSSQLQHYMHCSESTAGHDPSFERFLDTTALWEHRRMSPCPKLAPYLRTWTYENGKLKDSFHGPKMSPILRKRWESYGPLYEVMKKGYVSEIEREDVYMCSRAAKQCTDELSEWEWRSRLYRQFRSAGGKPPGDMDNFCCFSLPLKNAMEYRKSRVPTLDPMWDPNRVIAEPDDIYATLMDRFDFVDANASMPVVSEFAESYFLLQTKFRLTFSFTSSLQFPDHFAFHQNATRKVYTWGLAFACGYSALEIESIYDYLLDKTVENVRSNSPKLVRDGVGAGAVFVGAPIRNRQKEFDFMGNADTSCNYYTNDRIAQATAYMRGKYSSFPKSEWRIVDQDQMTDAFPEGILDGSHMCTGSSMSCQEAVFSILNALFMP